MKNFRIIQIMSISLILLGFSLGVYFSNKYMSFETGGKTYIETVGKVKSYNIFEKYIYCAYSTLTIMHSNNQTCSPIDSFNSCDSSYYYDNRLKVDKDLHYYYPIDSDYKMYYNVDDTSDCLSWIAGNNYGTGNDVLKGIYYAFLSVVMVAFVVLILSIPTMYPSVLEDASKESIELEGSYSQV